MDDFNNNGCYAVVVELSRYWLGFTITQMCTLEVYIWNEDRPERVVVDLLKAATCHTDVTFKVVSVTNSKEGVDPSYLEDEVADLVRGILKWTNVHFSEPDQIGEALDKAEELLKAELLNRQS